MFKGDSKKTLKDLSAEFNKQITNQIVNIKHTLNKKIFLKIISPSALPKSL